MIFLFYRMLQTILLTALSAQLTFAQPVISSHSSLPQSTVTRVLPEKNYVTYVVKKNDTLQSIARTYYGSKEYWITVWNDNPTIVDPENLIAGTEIIIYRRDVTQTNLIPVQKVPSGGAIAMRLSEPVAGSSARPVITEVPTATRPSQAITPAVSIAPATVMHTVNNGTISDEALTDLGNCEAGMDPTRNSGNGYYGAFQFSYGTWQSLHTGYVRADLAPIDVQKAAVRQLLQRSNVYTQFPACARKLHAAGVL